VHLMVIKHMILHLVELGVRMSDGSAKMRGSHSTTTTTMHPNGKRCFLDLGEINNSRSIARV